MLYLIAKVNHL